MGIEFELKFRIDGESMEALAAAMGEPHLLDMETTYYDTPDGALSRRRSTLRRRLESGKSVCTLKTPAGPSARNEWEVECDSIFSAIMQLCQAGAPWELMRCAAGGVQPICGAKFTRLAKIHDVSKEELLDVFGESDVTVSFWLEWSE